MNKIIDMVLVLLIMLSVMGFFVAEANGLPSILEGIYFIFNNMYIIKII